MADAQTQDATALVGNADLIFRNGRIYTVDARSSWSQAVAVKNGKIVAVGDEAEIMKWQGAATTINDLAGRMMMPGLVDVHNHHTRGGQMDLYEVTFQAYRSFDEILELVKTRAQTLPPGEWICGGIWSSELIGRLRRMEAKAALDAASLGHPVMLRDDSMHNRWVNSRALELMEVTTETPDPADGQIVREQGTGKPVGLLFEKASALAERAVAKGVNDAALRDIASTKRAVEILNSYGVTAYQDANTTLPMLKALSTLDRDGALNAWCVASLPAFDTLSGTDVYGDALIARRDEFRSKHVRPDFVKLFMDGVPMTRTAAMLAPYAPDEQGHAVLCRPFIAIPNWCAGSPRPRSSGSPSRYIAPAMRP